MIEYKGYLASPVFDAESATYSGVVLNASDTIHFEGETELEAEQAFRESVDEYLEMCRDDGILPEPPRHGELRIHIDAQVFEQLARAAGRAGENVDTFVGRYLTGSFQEKM